MKKLLSYLLPQTTRVASHHSGMLEITIINGKKLLDSNNANYSYGSLQRILEFGLSKIDFKNIHSILILGLGGGSIIQSLRLKFNYQHHITAVEIDQAIIEIAEKEFGICQSPSITILNTDAFTFVNETATKFDLIIIDLFIDNKVPDQFYSEEFGKALGGMLTAEGYLLFNLGMQNLFVPEECQAKKWFETNNNYTTQTFNLVNGTNTLLVVKSLGLNHRLPGEGYNQ